MHQGSQFASIQSGITAYCPTLQVREFHLGRAKCPYANWLLPDRLQMLAFEAELAPLPRSLILVIWQSLDQSNQWRVTRAHSQEEPRAVPP